MTTINWPVLIGVGALIIACGVIYVVAKSKGYIPERSHQDHHPGLNIGLNLGADDEDAMYPPLPIPID